jgi:hypothetical protein
MVMEKTQMEAIASRFRSVANVAEVEVSERHEIVVHVALSDFSQESRFRVIDAELKLYRDFPDAHFDVIIQDCSLG